MTDDIIAEQDVPGQIVPKHKGALGEMRACVWLLERGYEVFRNISDRGAVDIIATRDDEILFLDAKYNNQRTIRGTDEQIKRKVKILSVDNKTGKIEIVDPSPPASEIGCIECGILFIPRAHQILCSKKCKAVRSMRAYRERCLDRAK